MGKYGALSPKPHVGWSNDKTLLQQIHDKAGYLSKQEREEITQVVLATSGRPSEGKKRSYTGNKKALHFRIASPLSNQECVSVCRA
jgi:hypothetical protein